MNKRNAMMKLASILLVAGIAIYFVGMRAFATQDKQTGSGSDSSIVYEEKEYTAPVTGIETILIDARNMPITVRPSDGDEIVLHYFTSEKDPYDVKLEGGALSLKYRNRNLFSNWFGWDFLNGKKSPEVQIDVPSNYTGSFQLDTSNAAITASGFANAGKIHAGTSNGQIHLSGMTATQVDTSTSNGAITLESLISSGSITAGTSNGAVTVNQAAAKDRMYLETSNGRISVDRVTSREIEMHSSNGSISGGVLGTRDDYAISSSTSNADNNLGSGGNGESKLTVSTSNGSINIRFLGK